MKYAVIKMAGRQYKVSEGDKIELERQQTPLAVEVLLFSDGTNIMIGTPLLSDVKVTASVIADKMGDKIRIARFRAKSRHRRVKGHRQPLSVVKIDEILVGNEKSKVVEEKKTPTKSKETVKKVDKKTVEKKKTVKKATTAKKSTKLPKKKE